MYEWRSLDTNIKNRSHQHAFYVSNITYRSPTHSSVLMLVAYWNGSNIKNVPNILVLSQTSQNQHYCNQITVILFYQHNCNQSTWTTFLIRPCSGNTSDFVLFWHLNKVWVILDESIFHKNNFLEGCCIKLLDDGK